MNKAATNRAEYGDWQTNYPLALAICQMLKREGVCPQVVIEPTCGKGAFILAALETFDSLETVYGIEINEEYLEQLKSSLEESDSCSVNVCLIHQNIFDVDFSKIKATIKNKNILVLGNPLWVTNSKLGAIGSGNLPAKSNFKKVKGLDAITGKGNFDIAEYITYQMISLLEGEQAHLAFLLKTSVIKSILFEQKAGVREMSDICQYNINAEREFGATVSAALLSCCIDGKRETTCQIRDFYTRESIRTFGWQNGKFVADCDKYALCKEIDGTSNVKWWSGLKHDCSKVMELTNVDGKWYNNLQETVDIEDDLIYPFLKSSDIKGETIDTCRKFVILTQHYTSEDTQSIRKRYPKTYAYLQSHDSYFAERKSVIYKNRPKYCLFGIGDYTFKPYRIAISGLYKQTRFSLVSEIDGKLALLDDTCYQLAFDEYWQADVTLRILNSELVQTFLRSLLFVDAKRPINKELLMRVDLVAALEQLGYEALGISKAEFMAYRQKYGKPVQMRLFA